MRNQALDSVLNNFVSGFVSNEPVQKLIRKTAIQQWKLLLVNFLSSAIESLSEGSTLGIVFLAVEVISKPADSPFDWANIPFLGLSDNIVVFLNTLAPSTIFLALLVVALSIQAVQGVARFINTISVSYFSARCRRNITSEIHSQILDLSFPCASAYKVGDLLDYANSGPEAVRIQLEQLSSLVILVLLCITYFAILLLISPWMLIAVLVIGSAIFLLQKSMIPRIRSGSELVSNVQVDVSTRITEDFQGLRLLHTYGQLDFSKKRLQSALLSFESSLRRQAPRLALLGPVSTFLPILAITLIAAVSLFFLGDRSSGILPSLVTFVIALQRLTIRIGMIATISNALADNSGRLKRANSILSKDGKDFVPLDGLDFKYLKNSIAFQSVSLKYKQSDNLALSSIDFTLNKGQTLALVGCSGAGKSSIADLLVGLYKPTSGQICIDDIPFDHYNQSTWQNRIGVVSQDTFLFNASIYDNVSFGSPNASMVDVKAACDAAQATRFIESLPESFSTVIGERGYTLSGGQRQRLSLARAILRDPDLFILDEATSALDSYSERLVQEAIENFYGNHTLLVIAHRLSTIAKADLILVMDKGVIMQRGTHEYLVSHPGIYRDLWLLQVGNT